MSHLKSIDKILFPGAMLHILFGVVIALLIVVGTSYYLANSANGKHKIKGGGDTVVVKKKEASSS